MSDEAPMTIANLSIDNFTVFDRVLLPFVPGLNVVSGDEQAITHALRLVYALYQAGEAAASSQDEEDDPMSLVEGVFGADDSADLRGPREDEPTRVKLRYERAVTGAVEVGYGLDEDGDPTASLSFAKAIETRSRATLLGKDDVLGDFPAFHDAEADDELPLNRDAIDLCFSLAQAIDGQGENDDARAEANDDAKDDALPKLVAHLEELLGGTVSRAPDGRSFLVHGDVGGHATPLHAEGLLPGLRTLVELVVLLRNGSIIAGDVLLWDSPAPAHEKVLAPVLAGLVRAGVQILVGTSVAALADALVAEAPELARRIDVHGSAA